MLAVVVKAVIRQAFIRQMPASIRAHLATTPDSTSLESLAVLADRAIASENDVKENSVGVAEVDSEKPIGIMENISRRLKKLETSGHQKKQFNNKQQTDRRRDRTTDKQFFFPNANARPFTPRMATNNNSNENGQNVVTTKVPNPRWPASPPNSPQTGTAQPMATHDALICYYHQRFGDKARLCRDPCAFALNC